MQGMADIEMNTARELTKLGAVIQVPFRAGNQFLGEGGLQVRPKNYFSSSFIEYSLPGLFLFTERQDASYRRSTCQFGAHDR
jgi:hypothetical protein